MRRTPASSWPRQEIRNVLATPKYSAVHARLGRLPPTTIIVVWRHNLCWRQEDSALVISEHLAHDLVLGVESSPLIIVGTIVDQCKRTIESTRLQHLQR